jgi:predicted GNAT family acetyltransferase
MLQFTVESDDQRRTIRATLDGQTAGEIFLQRRSSQLYDVTHTGVPAAFEGRGFGKALVAEAVNLARTEACKLQASCWYAAKVLARTPDYQDVWVPPTP